MSKFQSHPNDPANINVTAAVGVPTDRVRWGPIIAGLFAAISTLAVLAVLGAAVAGTAYDPGDSARSFGIGAGVWGAISALLAFFIGGWLSARSAAVRGHGAGLLNGAMVWVATIPLMMIVGSMIASRAAAAAGQAAQTAATAASGAAIAASNRPDLTDQAQPASARIGATTQEASNKVNNAVQEAKKPENQEKAADATAKTAWGTLVAMLLGLGAAALGGHLGGNTDRLGRRDIVTDTSRDNR